MVANRTIHAHNLTILMDHDYLLLSFADMSRAILHKGVLTQLLHAPNWWFDVAKASTWFKPLLAVTHRLALYIEELRTDLSDGEIISHTTLSWVAEMLPRVAPSNMTDRKAAAKAFKYAQKEVMAELMHVEYTITHESPIPAVPKAPTSRPVKKPVTNTHLQRRLLQTVDAVQQYSALTAALNSFNNVPLADVIGDIWLQGPIGWPPRFEYWTGDHVCTIGSVILDLLVDTSAVLQNFYTNNYTSRFKTPPWDIAAQIPQFPTSLPSQSESNLYMTTPTRVGANADNDLIAYFYNSIPRVMSLESITSFFSSGKYDTSDKLTLGKLAKELLICDFEATTLCTKQRRNLAVSFVIAYILYWIVSSILASIGLPGVGSLLFWTIPSVALYLAYGMAPTCFPQIPTCLLNDVINVAATVMPAKIIWPNALQYYTGCLGPTWIQLQAGITTTPIDPAFPNIRHRSSDCLRSCTKSPFLFASWEANAAWLVCGVTPNTCVDIHIPYFPAFNTAANAFVVILRSADPDVISANTFCNVFTLARALPWVFALIIVIFTVVGALRIPVVLITATTQFMVQALGYTHAE